MKTSPVQRPRTANPPMKTKRLAATRLAATWLVRPGRGSGQAGQPGAVTAVTAAEDDGSEIDLDDQTSVMGDSVHTYLKSIGRTSLLTAEQEVDLAKRIEAGLFAEHKLETEPE